MSITTNRKSINRTRRGLCSLFVLPALLLLLLTALMGGLFTTKPLFAQTQATPASTPDVAPTITVVPTSLATPGVLPTDTVTPTVELTPPSETMATDEVSPTTATTSTQSVTMTQPLTDPVLLQLNERRITPREFNRAFVRAMRTFANRQGIPINPLTIFFFDDLRDRYLDQVATEEALLAQARARGLAVSDAEVENVVRRLQMRFANDEEFRRALPAFGFADENELRTAIREQALIGALFTELQSEITVTDEEIRTFYEDNRELFRVGPGTNLFLKQVEEPIRRTLERQKLEERIAQLRTSYNVDVFRGNLTPFDELLLDELRALDLGATAAVTGTTTVTRTAGEGLTAVLTGTQPMTDGMNITGTSEVTATEAFTAIDVVPATEIPPIPITDTETITDVGANVRTDTETITSTSGVTTTAEVPATAILPITDAETVTDTINIPADASLQITETMGTTHLRVLQDEEYGAYLANENGRAFYVFTRDRADRLACRDVCARIWPPALTATVPETTDPEVDSAQLGTIERDTGPQATYNGRPLYYFSLDEEAGDTLGQGNRGFDGEWYLISPTGEVITNTAKVAQTPGSRLSVTDQAMTAGTVTVMGVVSDGPGWIVLYADENGAPGVLWGQAAVPSGISTGVTVMVSPENATETIHAMLYHDAGIVGAFEVPDPDEPVLVNGEQVHETFRLEDNVSRTTIPSVTPSITVENQIITDGTITIAEVVSDGPAWLVIHNNEQPYAGLTMGPVVGHSPIDAGVNQTVEVTIEMTETTGTLYAMLYRDKGRVGAYEVPTVDTPVSVDGEPVRQTFTVDAMN